MEKYFTHYITLLLSVFISMMGTQVTTFALGIWLYQSTGSATLFSLLGFSAMAPQLLLSPLLGILVDRFNHRHLLTIGQLGTATTILLLPGLYHMELLHPWLLILISAIASLFNGLLFLTLNAMMINLIPNEQLTRMQSISQAGFALLRIGAPALAGIIHANLGLWLVFSIDTAIFLLAFILLFLVPATPHHSHHSPIKSPISALGHLQEGWRYLLNKPGLLALTGLMSASNFVMGMVMVLITPFVLNFKGSESLGVVFSSAGFGMLIGSIFIFYYGKAKNNVPYLLKFNLLCSGSFFIISLQGSIMFVIIGAFFMMFGRAIVLSCYQSFWQRKIHPQIQGRVLGLRVLLSGIAFPLGYLIAGPMADYLEPMMQINGGLASSLGFVIGVGTGRGIALLFTIAGLVLLTAVLCCFFIRSIKTAEQRLPNYGFNQ